MKKFTFSIIALTLTTLSAFGSDSSSSASSSSSSAAARRKSLTQEEFEALELAAQLSSELPAADLLALKAYRKKEKKSEYKKALEASPNILKLDQKIVDAWKREAEIPDNSDLEYVFAVTVLLLLAEHNEEVNKHKQYPNEELHGKRLAHLLELTKELYNLEKTFKLYEKYDDEAIYDAALYLLNNLKDKLEVEESGA